jgi:hypothetical protein
MNCFDCGRAAEVTERIGFRDECEQCGRPLHVCLNCGFHDRNYNNECREPQAERVVDKERFNFCEYFTPAHGAHRAAGGATAAAKASLDALFKKK